MGLVSDAVRAIGQRDGPYLGGIGRRIQLRRFWWRQLKASRPGLFSDVREGNFIEASDTTPYLQTGKASMASRSSIA